MQAGIRAARLCQRARLLQLAALELHCADLAVQSASCKALLEVFFLPAEADDDTGTAAVLFWKGDMSDCRLLPR